MSAEQPAKNPACPEPPAAIKEPVIKEPPLPKEVLADQPSPEKFNKFETADQGFDINKDQYDMEKMLDSEHAAVIKEAALAEKKDAENARALRLSSSVLSEFMDKYLTEKEEVSKKKWEQHLDNYFAKPTNQTVSKGDSPPPKTAYIGNGNDTSNTLSSFGRNNSKTNSINNESNITSSSNSEGLQRSRLQYYSNNRDKLGMITEEDEYIHIPSRVFEAPDFVKKPDRVKDRFFLWLHPSSFKIKLSIAAILSIIFIGIFSLFGWALLEYSKTLKKNM